MYSSNYEDYMQQVLGYSIMPRNTYQMQDIYNIEDYRDYNQNELENMYPDKMHRYFSPHFQYFITAISKLCFLF